MNEDGDLEEEQDDETDYQVSTSLSTTPSSPSGSLFRSEEMSLCQLFLQAEAAYACVSELGELGLVQFRDLNPETNTFQRKFVNEVRRCDEMERKLRFLEKEIKKDEIPMLDTGDCPEAPQPREMVDLEAQFEKLEHELKEVNQNSEALKRNYLELTELKHILRKASQFFDEKEEREHYSGQHQHLIQDESGVVSGLQLGFVAGVILRDRLPHFEKLLWRACRGNVFLKTAEIEDRLEDPHAGDEVFKCVFVIFFQGEQLKSRVKKICEGFRATVYPCPDQAGDRREMAVGVMQRLDDLNTVLGQTNDHRGRLLVAAAKNIKIWFVKVRKIKAIYHTLNFFNLDTSQKCLIAECWVPSLGIEMIQMALRRGTEKSGSDIAPILNQMQTTECPPTFFRTNKFTSAFQELINAYGVASYREINPTVFTLITFPFLFGVMFGDAGHGVIMFGFASWCIMKEKQLTVKKSDSEIWNIFFAGRYLIALMGIFSIYTGLIYNDIFSKSINLFKSSWQVTMDCDEIINNHTRGGNSWMIDPAHNKSRTLQGYTGHPYPFGVDPVWQISLNKIVFLNAFKMKVSIIIGVIHMLFGVILSLFNNKYFRKSMNIYCEFIPQVLFLVCMFGYLAILMFHKWTSYVAGGFTENDIHTSERCAPSILISFINMVLCKPNESEKDKEGNDICDPYLYSGQRGLQFFLLFLALICIPWMLLVKPFLLRRQEKQRPGSVDSSHGGSDGEFDFMEIMILQGIHTIEYVLGSVSHTASYLRLWALSLAHAQLSEVLWTMVFRIGLAAGGITENGRPPWYAPILLWAIFAAWAVLTISILCLMEGLSAFLHTLRLHWVEFQSKFYSGQGYLFTPFAFSTILKHAEEID